MNTMLDNRSAGSSWSWAVSTCSMISCGLRLRFKPMVPVRQKPQSSVQPTCVETHKVRRPSSGIRTASTSRPSSSFKINFRVSSAERNTTQSGSRPIRAWALSLARSAWLKSVISAIVRARRWYNQRRICPVRYAGQPKPATRSAISASSSASRLGAEEETAFMAQPTIDASSAGKDGERLLYLYME